jgi:membrane protein implicated in regulation of membrane protease activity
MNATPEPHGPVEPLPDEYAYEHGDGGFDETLPVRPRRPFLTKWSALLMALMLGAVGFFVGVRVEKGKIPAASSSSGASAFARAFSGAAGATSKSGASSFASRFAGAFGGANSNATAGSVSSIDGKTLYVTETSGNTVKVKLSGQTTITKSESVSRTKVYPGDEVVITGAKGSGGTVTATSITDSGASSTGSTGSTGGGASSSPTSGASAISSLFGGS